MSSEEKNNIQEAMSSGVGLEQGTYEIIRNRLLAQGKDLQSRLGKLERRTQAGVRGGGHTTVGYRTCNHRQQLCAGGYVCLRPLFPLRIQRADWP